MAEAGEYEGCPLTFWNELRKSILCHLMRIGGSICLGMRLCLDTVAGSQTDHLLAGMY